MVAAQFLRLRETGMRLTAYTDCALRVLIRLALQQHASQRLRIAQRGLSH